LIKCQTVNKICAVLNEELKPVTTDHFDTSQLVELLQKSAVEHLTTIRQLKAQPYGSLVMIATPDIEALYLYKQGDYRRCLQLSTQNVRTLIGHPEECLSFLFFYPEFTQLMDDDIVSVLALTLIVDPSRTVVPTCASVDQLSVCIHVGQLSLSLYLMVKCQMQLHHSVTSLAQSLDYIQDTRRRRHLLRHISTFPANIDILVLKLAERSVLRYLGD